MPDLERARLMLRLAQDDLAAMEVVQSSQRISPGIFGLGLLGKEERVRRLQNFDPAISFFRLIGERVV